VFALPSELGFPQQRVIGRYSRRRGRTPTGRVPGGKRLGRPKRGRQKGLFKMLSLENAESAKN
jgi:hypothetical protein